MKRILAIILVSLLLFCSCQKQASVFDSSSVSESNTDNEDSQADSDMSSENSTSDSDSSSEADSESSVIGNSEMFTDRDLRDTYDESEAVLIELNGSSAVCSSDAVKITDSTVMILDEGTFILSGTLDDGMIVVNADEKDKPQLVLNGVSVTSSTSAALYVLEADKVCVTLAAGTSNELANGGTFTAIDENNIDGAVFSKQDLTFNGSGSLTITSPADHGIVCKDDLVITGGTYTVNCAAHGLDANDSVRMVNTTLTIDAGKDGIHAENSDDAELGFIYIENGTYTIAAEGDGISAGSYMQIEDGTYDILSGGGSENAEQQTSDDWGGFMGGGFPGGGMGGGKGGMGGGPGGPGGMEDPGAMGDGMGTGMGFSFESSSSEDSFTEDSTAEDDSSTSIKGIKATSSLTINGGTFTIDSADDSVHSNTEVTVNGGTFDIASGDDGFHADETLTINDATITISKSYEGLEALNILIAGGTIDLVASDDGLNAAGGTDSSGTGGPRGGDMFGGMGGMGGSGASDGSIIITGGTVSIQASGDGIDANGYVEITSGYTTVCGPTQGDTATLDYDTTCDINGGTFIGTGASGMAQTFSSTSEQGVIAVQVGNQNAGTELLVLDSEGNTLIRHTPELDYAVVIISTPDIAKGDTFTMQIGDVTGDVTAS